MPSIDTAILIGSTLLIASVLLSKASGRLGLPALLVFIGIGMLAGSEGPGGIAFDNYAVAQAIGIVALVLILFDGGVSTNWRETKPIAWQGLSLSTLGVFLTAVFVALAARHVLNLTWTEALLLGAIASSTDAAAVFSILRSRSASLKGRSQALLEFESGSNDPMAVFLTIGFLSLLSTPTKSPLELIPMFAQQVIIGAAIGYGGGRLLAFTINRIRLGYEGLYPVLTLGAVGLLYSITSLLGGSGFLAVYLAGLVLGQFDFIHKRSLIRFHNGVAWISQIGMFLTLGLLAFPSHLIPVAKDGSILAIWLILVARPVSVFVSLAFSKLSIQDKLIVSWVGLRGATPIILATFPFLAGIRNAELMFNVVFFVVLISVLLQGTLVPFVAKILGVYEPEKIPTGARIEFSSDDDGQGRLVEVTLTSSSPVVGKQLVDLGLPDGVLIAHVTREGRYFVPRGNTVLEAGDHLTILTDRERLADINKSFVTNMQS